LHFPVNIILIPRTEDHPNALGVDKEHPRSARGFTWLRV